jgi:hypothetical protein
MPVKVTAETRAKLRQIEESIGEDDLADRALVHALVRADWYRTSMRRNRVRYLLLEAGALLLASAATVLAALSAPAWITATVAATVTFLAGLRRIVAWHDDWVAHAEAWTQSMALIAQYRCSTGSPAPQSNSASWSPPSTLWWSRRPAAGACGAGRRR